MPHCVKPTLNNIVTTLITPSKMASQWIPRKCLYIFTFLSLKGILLNADGHAHLSDPLPRGTLPGSRMTKYTRVVDRSAPHDFLIHFPSGDKRKNPGSGLRSQVRATSKWVPFQPLKKGFKWRAGVCGDMKTGKAHHKRGGKFYYGGKITRTFVPGTDTDFQAGMAVHHNGFMELHICDVSKCGGEISATCFQSGACKQLRRSRNQKCDSGKHRWCGPIDRKYPGRWYVPCPEKSNKEGLWDLLGREGTMKYRIPDGFYCEHCVLHWMYSSANQCNVPGLANYFKGRDRPVGWAKCKGQNGASGGYSARLPTCGGNRYAEEYFNCADVRVVKAKRDPFELFQVGYVYNGNFNVVKELKGKVSIKYTGSRNLNVIAKLKWPVKEVRFFMKRSGTSKKWRVESIAPFYFFGSDNRGRPNKWQKPFKNEWIELIVTADGFKRSGWLFLDT